MSKPWGFLILFLALLACSGDSSYRLSPTQTKQAKAWGADYVRARDTRSCADLHRLASDPTITTSRLARIRDLEYCGGGGTALAELDGIHADPTLDWLQPLALESLVNLALANNDATMLVKHALARSRQLGSQAEKEALLNSGLRAARSLGLTPKIAEYESELYRISPRLRPTPDESHWLAAADDFRANENWTEALALYEQSLVSPNSPLEGFRALNGIREVHKAKFRFYGAPVEDFMRASARAASFAESQLRTPGSLGFDDRRQLFEGWMQYARDEWSYDDVVVAHREIARMLSYSGLEVPFRAHAYWTLARIYANVGDWLASAENGERGARLLEADLPNSANWGKWQWTLWDDVSWTSSLALRKSHDWAGATARLELALKFTRNPSSESKFLFWIAQSLRDQGATVDAESHLRRLTIQDPYGFYGFLAFRDLSEPLSNLPDLDLENPVRPASVSPNDFDLLVSLVYADERPLAQKYSQRFLSRTSVDMNELFLRAFVHDYSAIQDIYFSRVPAADRNAFVARYARLFYPLPFRDEVDAAVSRNPRLDKEYVYSIMRQESSFNPLSHSWANAYGLLQILPQVARDVMPKAGVYFNENYELYRPEVNIPLGVAHMDDLFDRAGEPFIVRTAAYNATVDKILEWRARLYSGNIYEFIEEIPYDETRSYIRLVMRNYIMNLRLNSAAPLSFPEHLLDL